jgi:uncharacterized Zn-binding protein involved in type VI secretion
MTQGIAARKSSAVFVVCLSPNLCWTPAGKHRKLVPYMIHTDLSKSMSVVEDVLFNGKPAFVMGDDSVAPKVEGNEAGVYGDVVTGVNLGKVRPIESASTVKAGGRHVVRENDLCAMNLKA